MTDCAFITSRPRVAGPAVLLTLALLATTVPMAAVAQVAPPVRQPAVAAPTLAVLLANKARLEELKQSTKPGDQFLVAQALAVGYPVSDKNPIRVPDPAGERAALDLVLKVQSPVWLEAAVRKGRILLASKIATDQQEGVRLLEEAARRGSGPAMLILANRDAAASQVPVKLSTVPAIRQAALRDNIDAMIEILKDETNPAARKSMTDQVVIALRRKIDLEKSASAALALASSYLDGSLGQRDVAKAVTLAGVAQQLGDLTSTARFMTDILEADDANRFIPQIRGVMLALARAGSKEAALALLQDYAGDNRLQMPANEVGVWLANLIEAGSGRALVIAGTLKYAGRLSGAVADSVEQSLRELVNSPALSGADLVAVAGAFQKGLIIERDLAIARKLLERGYSRGDDLATAELGVFLVDSANQPTREDRERGITILREAVRGKSLRATIVLGDLLQAGDFVQQSVPEALRLFERAAIEFNSSTGYQRYGDLLLRFPQRPGDRVNAIKSLRQASELGNATALVSLGQVYSEGLYVKKDLPRAMEFLEKAVELKSNRGTLLLSSLLIAQATPASVKRAEGLLRSLIQTNFFGGVFPLADLLIQTNRNADALTMLEQSLARGYANAGVRLAGHYIKGDIVQIDLDKASAYVEQAIKTGQVDGSSAVQVAEALLAEPIPTLRGKGVELLKGIASQGERRPLVLLAKFFRETGINGPDMVESLVWTRRAAELGVIEEIIRLGNAYEAGTGVTVDKHQAFKLYERAYNTESTNGDAAMALSHAYLDGIGTSANPLKAREILTNAAGRGTVEAMVALANLLSNGIGGPIDPSAAIRWLEDAQDAGSVEALVLLGRYYASGLGTRVSPERAFINFSQAADLGSIDGAIEVANCYINGFGVARSAPKARQYLEKTLASGDIRGYFRTFMYYMYVEEAAPTVQERKEKALFYLKEASRLGGEEATLRLANSYFSGDLGTRNIETGVSILAHRVKQGSKVAHSLMEKLAKGKVPGFTPDELAMLKTTVEQKRAALK